MPFGFVVLLFVVVVWPWRGSWPWRGMLQVHSEIALQYCSPLRGLWVGACPDQDVSLLFRKRPCWQHLVRTDPPLDPRDFFPSASAHQSLFLQSLVLFSVRRCVGDV